MKLKFKVQPYQTNAVNDVVDCFAGQPMTSGLTSGLTYRIDPGRKALDAYNQKLVKKIAVRGIQTRGLANAYLYLEGIEISKKAPVARIEMEVKLKSGEIKRQLRRLEFRMASGLPPKPSLGREDLQKDCWI